MTERQAMRILKRRIEALGGRLYTIPDSGACSVRKPFDAFGWLNGRPLYVELKLCRLKRPKLQKYRVEPHQEQSLLEFLSNVPGAVAIFVIAHQPAPRVPVAFYVVNPDKPDNVLPFSVLTNTGCGTNMHRR